MTPPPSIQTIKDDLLLLTQHLHPSVTVSHYYECHGKLWHVIVTGIVPSTDERASVALAVTQADAEIMGDIYVPEMVRQFTALYKQGKHDRLHAED